METRGEPVTSRQHIFLCNEVVRELDFRAQCRFARDTGYDGLELAPFTLAEDPTRLTATETRQFATIAREEGTRIAGLHWLLAAPAGLSITCEDRAIAVRTCDVGRRLVDLCAGLGGAYLVHGSPRQRELVSGREAAQRAQGIAYFGAMAAAASAAGLAYVIEPLARQDTAFVNTIDEALGIIAGIGSPSLRTMIDCYAAAANDEDIAALLDPHLASGAIFHVHFNDDNKGAPGDGALDFAAILGLFRNHGFKGGAAVEPFEYLPDGPACAARAIRHLRRLESEFRRDDAPAAPA